MDRSLLAAALLAALVVLAAATWGFAVPARLVDLPHGLFRGTP